MTLRILVPIFSKTNEESPSFTRLWSRAFVSDKRKRLFSRFCSRTSSSILANRRKLLIWRKDNSQELTILLFLERKFSHVCNNGISSDSAMAKISALFGDVFVLHSSALFRLFSTVVFLTSFPKMPDSIFLK